MTLPDWDSPRSIGSQRANRGRSRQRCSHANGQDRRRYLGQWLRLRRQRGRYDRGLDWRGRDRGRQWTGPGRADKGRDVDGVSLDQGVSRNIIGRNRLGLAGIETGHVRLLARRAREVEARGRAKAVQHRARSLHFAGNVLTLDAIAEPGIVQASTSTDLGHAHGPVTEDGIELGQLLDRGLLFLLLKDRGLLAGLGHGLGRILHSPVRVQGRTGPGTTSNPGHLRALTSLLTGHELGTGHARARTTDLSSQIVCNTLAVPVIVLFPASHVSGKLLTVYGLALGRSRIHLSRRTEQVISSTGKDAH